MVRVRSSIAHLRRGWSFEADNVEWLVVLEEDYSVMRHCRWVVY